MVIKIEGEKRRSLDVNLFLLKMGFIVLQMIKKNLLNNIFI